MIRPATPADAPGIAQVEAAAAHRPWSEQSVRSVLDQPTCVAFVAAGDPLAGHLLTVTAADEAEIHTIAVHPDHRRRGLARQLLAAGTTAWRARGVRSGFLEVRADNAPAIALYRSEGWVESGRRARYYHDGTDALLFRWSA